MFGYMTELDTVDIVRTEEINAEGEGTLIQARHVSHAHGSKTSISHHPISVEQLLLVKKSRVCGYYNDFSPRR